MDLFNLFNHNHILICCFSNGKYFLLSYNLRFSQTLRWFYQLLLLVDKKAAIKLFQDLWNCTQRKFLFKKLLNETMDLFRILSAVEMYLTIGPRKNRNCLKHCDCLFLTLWNFYMCGEQELTSMSFVTLNSKWTTTRQWTGTVE